MGKRLSLGGHLRSWRVGAGVTQLDAAKAAGVTQATWSKWERDEMAPSAKYLKRIVAATGGVVSVESLVGAAHPVRSTG